MNPDALALVQRYDAIADELESEVVERIDKSLDAAFRKLEREFLKEYPKIQSEGSLLATQRRAVLLNDLAGLLEIVAPADNEQYQKMFEGAIAQAQKSGGDLGGKLIEAIAPGSSIRPFAAINIEAVALQARDGVKRLYRHSEDFRGRVSGIVEQGLIQGWGARRVAGAIASEVGTTKSKAESIARTETLSALNDGAKLRYQQNGIEYIQLVTSKGDVCPYCVARNMQVYEVGKLRVPLHVRCRCIVIPFSKEWQADGLTDDAFTAQYRDDAIASLRAEGKEPNYGPAPFEKAAGLTSAPKPVWKPGEAPLEVANSPKQIEMPSKEFAQENFRPLASGDRGDVYTSGDIAYKYGQVKGDITDYEITFTREAGELGIGPKLLASGNNSYAMEFLRGYRPYWELTDPLSDQSLSKLPNAGQINRNMVNALRSLHEAGLSHNDLHLNNVMVNAVSGDVRIIDYGQAAGATADSMFFDLRTITGQEFVDTVDGKKLTAAAKRLKKENLDAFQQPDYEQRTRAAIARFYNEIEDLDLTPKKRRR